MRPSLLSLLGFAQALGLAASLALEKRATCNADNCLRAVRATTYGPAILAMRSADCSSFFDYTFTPATSTSTSTVFVIATSTPVTVTLTDIATITDITTPPTVTSTTVSIFTTTFTPLLVTVTATAIETDLTTSTASTTETTLVSIVTITPPYVTSLITTTTGINTITNTDIIPVTSFTIVPKRDLEARQTVQSPSAIPSYASSCSGTVRYSSACSCLGVTPVIRSAATPISVVTTTVTNTVTTAAPDDIVTVTTTTDVATVAPTVTSSTVTTDVLSAATPTTFVTISETDSVTLPAPTTTIIITAVSTLVAPTPTFDVTVDVAGSATVVATATATSIIDVCSSANNYNLVLSDNDVSMPSPVGLTTVDIDGIGNQACCQACYLQTGCILFNIDYAGCTLFVETAGNEPDQSPECPYGIVTAYGNPGSNYGVGPCGFVEYM